MPLNVYFFAQKYFKTADSVQNQGYKITVSVCRQSEKTLHEKTEHIDCLIR